VKIIKIEFLIQHSSFRQSSEFQKTLDVIENSILSVSHPKGNRGFTLYPAKKANGVVPIKKDFLDSLIREKWQCEHRMSIASRVKPGPVDAVKKMSDGRYFAVEWETGNISSSHRGLNKMAVGLLDGVLSAGILILPSRNMYQYLTDRIGNYSEIEPYFPVWKNLQVKDGVLAVIEIEHDAVSTGVPVIKKDTDGRALR